MQIYAEEPLKHMRTKTLCQLSLTKCVDAKQNKWSIYSIRIDSSSSAQALHCIAHRLEMS